MQKSAAIWWLHTASADAYAAALLWLLFLETIVVVCCLYVYHIAAICIFQSSNIRTVIKTPGIRWTKERGLQQQRWAHFSVDRKHHLLSVLSRLSPSHDWCVGVSALDLCLDNCTWLADTSIRLFAWDAGVRHGDSYASENRQSYLVQPIHRLNTRAHDNPELLYRSGKPADSMAVLQLQRFDPDLDDDSDEMCSNTVAKDQGMATVDELASEINHTHHSSCIMGSWSRWSRCSVTCGTGTRTRTRTAVVATVSCAELLQMMSKSCKITDCVAQCKLHEWSEWSACSDGLVLCSPDDPYVGFCSRRRNRFYRHPGAEEVCNDTVVDEEPCQPSDTGGIFAAFNTEIMSKCFSPADSGPCKGNILRWYYDSGIHGCRTFPYSGCRGNANRYTTEEDCMQACRQYKGNMIQTVERDIGTTRSADISEASAEVPESDSGTPIPDSNVGDTLAYAVDCVMSPWSAWSGCSVTCGRNGVRTRLRTVRRQPSGGGRKCPRRKLRRRRCSMPACSTECQYTEWSPWSPCARSCGADTVQERIQRVQGSLSRRSQCPVKLQRRLCALPQCFDN